MIKSGDLCVFTTSKTKPSLFGKIIRLATQSNYSHVGVAWVVNNHVLVVEANFPEVRIMPIPQENVYYVDMSIEWTDELENLLLSYAGMRYSLSQAVFSYWTTPKVDKQWQCVELAKDFYRHAGFDIESDYTPSSFVTSVLDSGYSLAKVQL